MEPEVLAETDDCRPLHACWALPGAVITLVLILIVFFGQFSSLSKAEASPEAVASAPARQAG